VPQHRCIICAHAFASTAVYFAVAEKLARHIAEALRPAALAELDAALSAVFASGAEARRRAREAAGVSLQDAFARLQLLSHGVQVARVDEVLSLERLWL
jgi:hypothetical protein